jgi:hypothetical protein
MRLVGSRGDYPYDEGKHLVAMTVLHACGDDSGTHQDAKFCLVLGYIGSPRQWKLFQREWQAALTMLPQREGKKPEFHGKEFFQRASWRSHDSPYHRWNEAKAETFLNRLLDAIHRHRLEPIGGGTNTEDFFAYSEDERRYLTGAALITTTHWYRNQFEIVDKLLAHQGSPSRPYFVVFPGFLLEAIQKSGNVGDCQVHITLDRQPALEARAGEVFDSFKGACKAPQVANLGHLTYSDSQSEVGLQAADLYAYAWYRKLTESMTGDLLKAFQVLTKKKPGIVLAGKRYFDGLLDRAIQERAAGINKGLAARS